VANPAAAPDRPGRRAEGDAPGVPARRLRGGARRRLPGDYLAIPWLSRRWPGVGWPRRTGWPRRRLAALGDPPWRLVRHPQRRGPLLGHL